MNRNEKQLEALLAPAVAELGFIIWGLEYLGQGKHSTLRVYIENSDGVSVDDCANVSREISALLDVEDPISTNYTLEVSSPGVDRVLFKPEQYPSYIGQQLDLQLNFPFEGRRKFSGQLTDYRNDEVVLQVEDNEYLFPVENVKRARIKPQYR